MSQTPYGSMSMNDFRRQQFVLVDGNLKLSDVDDTGFEDPTCQTSDDCDVTFSSANFSQRTLCRRGRCVQYNEKKNLFNAGRHFVTFLLPHGAPRRLQPIIASVVEGYTNLTMSSEQLLKRMNKIVKLYRSGWYLNRTKSKKYNSSYKQLEQSDLPGQHDYRCQLSISMATCTVSVFDLREAEDVCNSDNKCRGFVVTQQKTWTGRHLIHLKNNIGPPSIQQNTTLYIKPTGR
ncbi:extracellular tyrosine-protein kinase PKDCC-like [Mercenaria mercenaria]|uniref:extracellular tyrosine-protein kinase PKDCC-like n=1 Tax=Mercenaria mercenaria TaxID=6596 RepID=UPI00234E82D4|nr:extracellular tyrosine-protein kinase PKDCC-like [Mercenaria mercenaria]